LLALAAANHYLLAVRFVWPQLAGQGVKYAIDVAMTLIRPEGARKLHALADHNLIWHFDMGAKFVSGNAQYGALDGIQRGDFTIEERQQGLVEFITIFNDPVHQFIEEAPIDIFHAITLAKFNANTIAGATAELPLVNGLHRTAPGAAARLRFGRRH
jgi:hypothetical protein